jgi:membrane protein DedA with SNARE-associated domain
MITWLDGLISGTFGAISLGNPVAHFSLLLITILTEAGVPFPFIIDSVLFVSGFQSGTLTLQLAFTMLTIFIGRQIGASIIYWLFRTPGTAFTRWIEKRFSLFHNKVQNIRGKLLKTSIIGVSMTRLTGLLTLVSATSGLLRLRYRNFVAGVALSSILFDGALVALGILAGSKLKQYGYVPPISVVILGCMLLVAAVAVIQFFVARRKFKVKNSPLQREPL